MPRSMEIVTPLGEDVLLFHRLHAREELGRLSEFHFELLALPKKVIDFDGILGANVTLRVHLVDDAVRYFNGFVTRFSAGGRYGRYQRYTATVSPWTWFLTRTSDCRIFQQMTVPEILEKVFADHPTADVKFDLGESYDTWTYCVQYRETDFNFVSRLMEHEGIFYYYRHTDGAHTMVITDSIDRCEAFPGYDVVKFIPPQELARPEIEHVSTWEISRDVQPGVFFLDDYDFERPSVDLRLRHTTPRSYTPSDYEWFDYPGAFVNKKRGDVLAQLRAEEFGSQFERTVADTNARGAAVGALFTLEGFPRDDQNVKHVIISSVLNLEYSDYEAMPEQGGSSCSGRFAAMTTAQPFRPRRITPKPFVQGPQTAVVVGPAGEEIYTDNYGRVKVQFHWDSRGENNEQSSCWIRVSHPWAGKAWGAVAIPRIGQEVVVDFLEGDPDQPIITGRVYNADQMPPYALPANKTQSGVKSRSSLGGGPANFNEIRFEDKMGAEQLFIHAEKNQDIEVENDETHWVGHDRKKTIDHDETTLVKHDRTETVDNDETITIHGKRTEVVDKDEIITIHMNRKETVDLDETIVIHGAMSLSVDRTKSETVVINSAETVGGAKELSVGGLYQVTVGAAHNTTVGGAKMVEVGGYLGEAVAGARTVAVGGSNSLTVGGDATQTVKKDWKSSVIGKAEETVKKEYTLKAKKITLQAEDEILISVGKAKIAMKKDGTVQVEGKDLSFKASGKINQKASGDVVVKGGKVAQN